MMKVNTGGGKYTVIQDDQGRLSALRYNEPWRDCVGDNLILALACDLEETREQLLKKDTQWHFPSKGELLKRVVIDFERRTVTTNSDPLPPIPEVKAEEDGFDEWWSDLRCQELNTRELAHAAWLAAQSALLNKGKEKEKE